jgi:hypothetical protein
MSVARGSIDPARYRRILGRVLPRVPRTEAENERLLQEVNKLISKPERELTPLSIESIPMVTRLTAGFVPTYPLSY